MLAVRVESCCRVCVCLRDDEQTTEGEERITKVDWITFDQCFRGERIHTNNRDVARVVFAVSGSVCACGVPNM